MADFSRDGDGVVTDNTTGLQWQDDINITKNWEDAIDYCETLTLGTHTDWRLPNFNELYSIVDRSKINPAIEAIFQNVVLDHYWSSTTQISSKRNAWSINFVDGSDQQSDKYKMNNDKFNNYNVRCVRVGQ
jgi:hypothetical protein